MRLWKAWVVAGKDLKTFRSKKNVLISTAVVPIVVSILIPLVIEYGGRKSGGIPASALPNLLNAFTFFFAILAAVLPTAIAAYGIAGEKIEKSLEPLLATPTTDGEILLGKTLAAFLPPIVSIYAGATIFMALMDTFTRGTLGYLFFPNWGAAAVLFLLIPCASIFSVLLSVLISARVSDVRAVQQLGGFAVLPFAAIYVSAEIGLVTLDTTNFLLICAVVFAMDIVLFFLSTAAFKREEILTRWK